MVTTHLLAPNARGSFVRGHVEAQHPWGAHGETMCGTPVWRGPYNTQLRASSQTYDLILFM